jgi:hypothetical protein
MASAVDALKRQRSYTSGSPAEIDSAGLEMPPEVMAVIQAMLMPPVTQGLGKFAGQLPEQMGAAGEAGAIFPEGMNVPLPKDKAALQELGQMLPDSRLKYLRNQALSDWHASNSDFPRVLADKWAMLTHAGGN